MSIVTCICEQKQVIYSFYMIVVILEYFRCFSDSDSGSQVLIITIIVCFTYLIVMNPILAVDGLNIEDL